jgi:hypothetical protein
MDEEIKKRIADYFEPHELVEYLKQITTLDIIEAFPEVLEEALDDIEELMDVKRSQVSTYGGL